MEGRKYEWLRPLTVNPVAEPTRLTLLLKRQHRSMCGTALGCCLCPGWEPKSTGAGIDVSAPLIGSTLFNEEWIDPAVKTAALVKNALDTGNCFVLTATASPTGMPDDSCSVNMLNKFACFALRSVDADPKCCIAGKEVD